MQDTPDREEMHRRRFRAVLDASPRLADFRIVKDFWNARFSPDGERIISGDAEGGATLWEVATGKIVRRIQPESGKITLGFFDPRGRVFTVDRAGAVQRWDEAGRAAGPPLPVWIATTERHSWYNCFDFSRDGASLAASVPGGGVQVFDTATGAARGPVQFAGRTLFCVRFLPDGRTLAVCGDGIGAQLVDAESGAVLWEIVPPSGRARLVAVSANGARLAVSGGEKLELWDIASRQRVCPPVEMPAAVYECRFSPDGSAITLSTPGDARTLDAASGRPTGEKMPHTSHVTNFGSSADGRFIATGGYDGFAREWNARSGQPVTPWLPVGQSGCDALLSPDGSRVLTTCGEEVRLWEMSSASSDRPRFPHPSAVRAIVSRDGRRIFTAGGNALRLRDLASGAEVWSAEFADDLADARLSADGRVVAAVTRDATLHLIEASSGKNLAPPRRLPFAPQYFAISPDAALLLAMNAVGESVLLARDPAVAPMAMPSLGAGAHGATFSPDGHFAAGTGFLGTCWIFDVQTRAATYRQDANPTQRATLIRFSADGRRAVLRGPRTIAEYIQIDPATGRECGPPVANPGLFPVEYTTDGRRMLTGIGETAAALADTATGQLITPPISETRPIFMAMPSPDGRLLATVNDANVLHIREVETGENVSPSVTSESQVREIEWSADGRSVFLTNREGATVVSVAPAEGDVAALRRQAELLSTHTLDASLHLHPLDREQIVQRWKAQSSASVR